MTSSQLPTRDGVGPSTVGLPGGHWASVIDFFLERFPTVDREVWLQRMRDGLVLDEQAQPVPPDAAYRPHTRLYYYRHLPVEPRIPFEAPVLFQDAHLLVVDKPHFLPTVPAGRFVQETLLVRLKQTLGLDQLAPLHRLDRETAGVTLFAIQPAGRGAYHALFTQRQVHKHYEAIAPWREGLPAVYRSQMVPGTPFFRYAEAPGEPNSETHIAVIERQGDWARYRLSPVTGRTHQLRVHMAALGAPIRNDRFYPEVVNIADDDYRSPLQLLARSIAFTDPVTGEARQFSSARTLEI
ncbi:RluA family pseudouridine synthase [Rhodoferax sp.]|uniref:RluA family pseudouridine synthase n=1 Tax=Rhodoferax sp. TaxID=50421 RepID=UPI00374D68D5